MENSVYETNFFFRFSFTTSRANNRYRFTTCHWATWQFYHSAKLGTPSADTWTQSNGGLGNELFTALLGASSIGVDAPSSVQLSGEWHPPRVHSSAALTFLFCFLGLLSFSYLGCDRQRERWPRIGSRRARDDVTDNQ